MRNQIDDEQSKYAVLLEDTDQRKIQQAKVQQELDVSLQIFFFFMVRCLSD